MAGDRFDHNKTIRGTFGKVWVDGDRMSNVRSFEAKLTIDYEDMDINGDFGQKKRYMGYSIAGTMTCFKVDSYIAKKIHKGVMNGDLPDIKIVAVLDDPTGYGAERVALYDVKFDELTLSQFENKSLTEEEVPFTAGSFEFLDLI
jgi:Protein of unknown function (DUF2001).